MSSRISCWVCVGLLPAALLPAASPTEERIARLEESISKAPDLYLFHNELADALVRRSRETGNVALARKADEALQESLRLAPGNFEARKLQVRAALARENFERALELATALNRLTPDDLDVYGFLVDAYRATGKLQEAEKAAQWMLDLRPDNPAGLLRAAEIRESYGEFEGALQLLSEVYRRTPQMDGLERALILVRAARVQKRLGRSEQARDLAQQAMRIFPESPQVRRAMEEHQ